MPNYCFGKEFFYSKGCDMPHYLLMEKERTEKRLSSITKTFNSLALYTYPEYKQFSPHGGLATLSERTSYIMDTFKSQALRKDVRNSVPGFKTDSKLLSYHTPLVRAHRVSEILGTGVDEYSYKKINDLLDTIEDDLTASHKEVMSYVAKHKTPNAPFNPMSKVV
jgi:hypothetical protein